MANNSNISGARPYTSRISDWEAFARLPTSLRDALNYAAFEWSAAAIYNWWRKGKYTEHALVRMIASWDKSQIERDAHRVWNRQVVEVSAEQLGL